MKLFIDMDVLNKLNLTPTEYCCLFGLYKYNRIHYSNLFPGLVTKGYANIEKEGDKPTLTKEGYSIFSDRDPDLLVFVDKYRLLFKKMSRRAGIMGDKIACYNKFIRFFKQYPEFADQELILNAAKMYIKSEENNNNFRYLQKADYVIYKQDTHKVDSSRLATFCEEITTSVGVEDDDDFDNIGGINV